MSVVLDGIEIFLLLHSGLSSFLFLLCRVSVASSDADGAANAVVGFSILPGVGGGKENAVSVLPSWFGAGWIDIE